MNQFLQNSAYFGVAISIIGYMLGGLLRKKIKHPLVNPLLISSILVIAFLLIFNIEYETYYNSAKYISYFLTPATVCFAIPLYRNLTLLKQHALAVFVGIISGVLASLVSILVLSMAFSLTHTEYVTLLPKSVTAAISMGISEKLGGYPAITTTVTVATGILGNIICTWVIKLFRIKHPVAKGIAIGSASHAIGTTKAFELGDIEGAMSSLAIVVSGLITVIAASLFSLLY